MEKTARILCLIALALLAPAARASDAGASPGLQNRDNAAARPAWREERQERWERREEYRDDLRQRRDAWRGMSPEERHQFRSDIRDAGRDIYRPRGHRRHR
jgi:hypothetical protein